VNFGHGLPPARSGVTSAVRPSRSGVGRDGLHSDLLGLRILFVTETEGRESMKNVVVAGFTSVLVLLLASTLTVSSAALTLQDCSCTAPDGSCSASISCQEGCLQHCAAKETVMLNVQAFIRYLG